MSMKHWVQFCSHFCPWPCCYLGHFLFITAFVSFCPRISSVMTLNKQPTEKHCADRSDIQSQKYPEDSHLPSSPPPFHTRSSCPTLHHLLSESSCSTDEDDMGKERSLRGGSRCRCFEKDITQDEMAGTSSTQITYFKHYCFPVFKILQKLDPAFPPYIITLYSPFLLV